MRWSQRTYKKYECVSDSTFTVVVTKENVAPFRSFEQKKLYVKGLPLDASMWKNGKVITRPFWLLPENIDELIEEMDKAREDKNWSRSDEIRDVLKKSGIVVRNGIDWYPQLLEKEYKAEKLFNAWYFSTAMSGMNSLSKDMQKLRKEQIKNTFDFFEQEVKDNYNL